MQLGIVVGLIIGIAIAFFAILNNEIVTISYYFGEIRTPVALVALVSGALGALAVGFMGFLRQIRTGFAMWDYKNKVRRLSKEVESLRNQKMALEDDLSYIQAESETINREKEELEHEMEEVQAVADEAAVCTEEKKDRDEE